MVLVGILVLLIAFFSHGPIITDQVELNTFAPVELIHLVDWVMAGGLVFFILTNVIAMHNSILRKGMEVKVPLSLYITEAWNFIVALVTQKRWVDCSEDNNTSELLPWIRHMLLVSGYGLMLVLVVFFLGWFQTDDIYPLWHPQRWLGYYATVVILFGCVSAIWGRFRKHIQMHKYSHASDWIFPILLIAVTLTGIVQHTFRYLELPLATYYTYVLHLALAAPMLILEVPFGKWSHLYYRPLAIYFQNIKEKATQMELSPEPMPVGD
jgi:nitrate reductase gamma subunit